MPSSLETKIDRIAKQYLKNQQLKATPTTKFIPGNWHNFASLLRLPSQKGKGTVPFIPYRYQQLICEGVTDFIIEARSDNKWKSKDNKFVLICNKFRQSGLTTSILALAFWLACQDKVNKSGCMFPTRDDARDQSDRLRELVDTLPEEYQIALSGDSVSRLQLLGLGTILLQSKDTRGKTLELLYCDEAAWDSKARSKYAASAPSLSKSKNGRIYLISTPRSKHGNFFYDFLADAVQHIGTPEGIGQRVAQGSLYSLNYPGFYWTLKPDSNVISCFIGHKANPDYSHLSLEEFVQLAIKQYNLSEAQAWREFGLTFDDADETVFSHEILDECTTAGISEKAPEEDSLYFASLDPNNGSTGNDYAVLLIYKIVNNRKHLINIWRSNKFNTNQSLFQIRQILSLFSPQSVFVETNGGGKNWADNLSQSNFNVTETFTTQANKANAVSELLLALESNEIVFDSGCKQQRILITELLGYKRLGTSANGGARYGASEGFHDDCVSSLLIGNHYINQELNNKSHLYLPYTQHKEIEITDTTSWALRPLEMEESLGYED